MIKHGLKSIAIVLVVLSAAFFFPGCSLSGPETTSPEELIIASWNVEALFDGTDNGTEYSDYSGNAGWTEEKYRARLNGISGAIKGNGDTEGLKADILVLIEIENPAVLEDLAESTAMDYHWAFFAGAPDSAIGFGVLSRFPLGETRVHSAHFPSGAVPRPVAEVRVDTGAGPLVLLVCHWKSKLGGEEKTEVLRRTGAGIAAWRIAEIAAEEPETPVIVLGDLNENYDEFTRIGGAYLCALIPGSAKAAELVRKNPGSIRPGFQDFLVVSGEKPPRTAFFTAGTGAADLTVPVLFSPWMENEMPDNGSLFGEGPVYQGSFYYKDTWETIDHFLLNPALFDGQGWEYGSFRLAAVRPFTGTSGVPQGYNPRTGSGLSDHLPIVLRLLLLDKSKML
ncbi:endonuclease [Spirochaetia bacterium]|nr:endonuclease [Spirochaetia bacterium]